MLCIYFKDVAMNVVVIWALLQQMKVDGEMCGEV